MNFLGLFSILLAQFISGSGIIRLFRLQLSVIATFCLSMITGVAMIAFVPCFMQLFHIPISATNTAIGIGAFSVLCGVPLIVFYKKPSFGKIKLPQLYEIPFLIVFLYFAVNSAWRCFYFPPTPRDVLAGAELLAEFTVREKTMLNSVFSIDLHTTNNQYKSPFLTSLQVIYKLFVCRFGQVWLTTLFVPFLLFLYYTFRTKVHSLIACILLMLFLAIPDVFAYSYIMLYDYSNMIFYFAGYYFFMQYLLHNRNNEFALSVFLFGIATYIRVETLVLVSLCIPLAIFYMHKAKVPVAKMAVKMSLLMAGPVFFYLLCMNVFVANFVPKMMDTAGQINQNLLDVTPFFDRISAINSQLLFSDKGVLVFGYFFYFFLAFLAVDIVFTRKIAKEARMALYGVAVVYLGLALLGYLLPLFDVLNTTKRGFFKAIPLILVYMANSTTLQKLSNYLITKEASASNKPIPPATQTAPVNTNKPNSSPKNKKVK